MKLFRYVLFDKYIYILALEMASPGNQHCIYKFHVLVY